VYFGCITKAWPHHMTSLQAGAEETKIQLELKKNPNH